MNRKRYVMNTAHKDLRGFAYLVYSAISLSLLMVMVFLPLAPAFADEFSSETVGSESVESNEGVDSESVPETSSEDESPETADETSLTDLSAEQDIPVVVAESTEEAIEEVVEEEGAEDLTSAVVEDEMVLDSVSPEESTQVTDLETFVNENDPVISVEGEDVVSEEEVVIDTDVEPQVDEIAQDTEESETEDGGVEATDTEEILDEEVDVSEEPIGEVITVNSVNDSRNEFSFSDNECTSAGDGTFYCVKTEAEAQVSQTDRIFSAPDKEGDREIYIEKDAVLVTLTDNQYDDEDPYYDSVSDTAVWHRLMNGRYQIISYDFDTEEETQLTSDHYNNMHPNKFGDALVWQGWVGNDWEIFLSRDGEVTMLTDNNIHDISPSINGTHIVWQSFENNAWQMKVYDIRTGVIDSVGDTDGGSIENPRFVLVYDTTSQSGDVETRGYDLKSGEVMELGATPVDLPEELPDPDQTGEDRAIVTTVTQLKPKTEGEADDVPQDDGIEPDLGDDDATIIIDTYESYPGQLEVGASTEEMTLVVDNVVPEIDVIESSQNKEHIEDLIVEPYVEIVSSDSDISL